ncbi:CAP domain-containing protein [Roseobacteraceae bacterium S113]
MRQILSVLAACALAGCGGGSGETASTAVVPVAAPESAGVNGFRASQGLPALAVSPQLVQAARAHALDMAEAGVFSHEGSNGSSVGERVRAAGYTWCFVAENIARGQQSEAQVITSWAGSPGHRANMASRKASAYGLYEGPGKIWVMVFAAPC